MQIEEVFGKVSKSKDWAEYRQYELGEMLECALSHIITLEVQATHLTKRPPDRLRRWAWVSIFVHIVTGFVLLYSAFGGR